MAEPKIFALIKCLLVAYAGKLRQDNPRAKIRNAAVFASAIPELAKHGYIELVDGKHGIPDWVPDFLVYTIKRVKYEPIWLPGPNFPDEPFNLDKYVRPTFEAGEIVWHHAPAPDTSKRWQQRRSETERCRASARSSD